MIEVKHIIIAMNATVLSLRTILPRLIVNTSMSAIVHIGNLLALSIIITRKL